MVYVTNLYLDRKRDEFDCTHTFHWVMYTRHEAKDIKLQRSTTVLVTVVK